MGVPPAQPRVISCLEASSSQLGSGQGLLVAAVDTADMQAVVLGAVPVPADGEFQQAADAVTELLPVGLYVVGTYSSSSAPVGWQRATKGVPIITATNTAAAGAAVWSVNGQAQAGGLPAAATAAAAGEGDGLNVVPGFVPVRAHVCLELQLAVPAAPGAAAAANGGSSTAASGKQSPQQQAQVPAPTAAVVQAGMQQLQAQLLAQPQRLVFALDQPGPVTLVTAGSSSSSVRDVLPAAAPGGGDDASDPCASLTLLQHTSYQQQHGRSKAPPAPMFGFQPASTNTQHKQQQQQLLLTAPLSLDVLCYAPPAASLATLHSTLLLPGLRQQLGAMQQQLLARLEAGWPLAPLRALHFVPPGLGFPVSAVYAVPAGSQEAAEAALLPHRQALHALLGLPANRPLLRFANALLWPAAAAAAAAPPGSDGSAAGGGGDLARSQRLRNVHEALTPPGFGGQLYLVDGLYEYFHYMQDRFNDAGWGCAYRSLQTIVSWFRLQHYTSKPVPGHRQIQETLVAIGDKEGSFVGSSQWIGSFELAYILDEYLGVTCKTIAINQGADIPSHARALAQHFSSQGTPVMIGGGVLAYTLLGVAWDEATGQVAFLILDPHYTGGEDLKKITQGGWVAWKTLGDTAAAGGPLFVKDAFYNFLCPQRPSTV